MKLIIPMAGRGTRLRPHTHVTPKPLIPVRGTSMVERIMDTFADVLPRGLDEAVFILGPDFGQEVRDSLTEIAGRHNMTASFGVQETALGTAHAVAQAGDHLNGECVIVFADTLFYMDEKPDLDAADALIWVKEVEDPRRFGVVVKDEHARITDFVEKPEEPISNEAIIGIYYVKDGAALGSEIQYLIDNDITGHGEYQLTDALDRMLKAGSVFKTASVSEWLDCGTIPALKETTKVILDKEETGEKEGAVENSILIEPVYVGPNARVVDSVVGPYVAVHGGAEVSNSVLKNTIVFADAHIADSSLDDSVIGMHAEVRHVSSPLNIGDHATAGPTEA